MLCSELNDVMVIMRSFQVQLESQRHRVWQQQSACLRSDEGAIPHLALTPSQEAKSEATQDSGRQGGYGQESISAENLSTAALHPGAGQALWLQIR